MFQLVIIIALALFKLTQSIVGTDVSLDTNNNYPYVGFYVNYINESLFQTCSCELIHSEWCLTAGHCVLDFLMTSGHVWFQSSILNNDTYDVYTGNKENYNGIEIDYWVQHPLWEHIIVNNGHDEYADYDIGLIHFVNPVSNIIPVEIGSIEDSQLKSGYDITLIGYGRHTFENTFGYGQQVTKGPSLIDDNNYINRRYSTMTIQSNTNTPKSVDYKTQMFRYISNANAGGCFGDSGGANIDKNTGKLIGVHVQAQGAIDNCAGNSFSVRLSDPTIFKFITDHVSLSNI